MYGSTYANMAEQFNIYLNSLSPDKIDEIGNDFRGNGNGLLSIHQKENATKLFDSFANVLLYDGETPPGIIG